MNAIRWIGVGCFWLLLAAPVIQRSAGPLRVRPLAGVEQRVPPPAFRPRTWFSGDFQRGYEAFFRSRMGFRPWLIRTHNQVAYSVFGCMPGGSGTQLLVGKDDWLFERPYVRHFSRPQGIRPRKIKRAADDLARLQGALSSRGIAFACVISPSKAETYPEYLPDLVPHRPNGKRRPYDVMREALRQRGVPVVDAPAMFAKLKPADPYPLFPSGGTHWSRYGALLVTREALALAASAGADVNIPRAASVVYRPAEGTDRDLADLMNLWRPPCAGALAPYPLITPSSRPWNLLPRTLIVGDSFSFTLIDILRAARSVGPIHLLYYNRRLYTYDQDVTAPDHGATPNEPVTPATLDWARVLLDKQIVILESNQILQPNDGWGFAAQALEAMEADNAR